MLHMVVNTHNPESCAFRSDEDDALLNAGIEQIDAIAKAREAEVTGFWVNTGSHTFFIALEAPNAHVVDEIIREATLTGRTHTQVYAVVAMDELAAAARAD